MCVFKIKAFSRWAKKQALSDKILHAAIIETIEGVFEANLGGNLYKKRIAIPGKGKRGSTRTLIAFKKGDCAFFIFGFDKGTRSNITDKEEHALKIFGNTLLSWSEKELNKRIKIGELLEIMEVQNGR